MPTLSIKILTVRQPYAGLIVRGVKDFENRSWDTTYRGVVAIHAGKSNEPEAFKNAEKTWRKHDKSLGRVFQNRDEVFFIFGAIIGFATLTEIIPPNAKRKNVWHNIESFAWKFTDQFQIPPIQMRGRLGLWAPDKELYATLADSYKKYKK